MISDREDLVRAIGAAAAVVLAGLVLSSCSGGGDASGGDPVAGKRLFSASGCDGCHTFAAAGSTGTVGPDLDDARPSRQQVIGRMRRGRGLMPSFAGRLSEAQMRDIAAFVGAGRASGTPVAKPFTPDKIRLADCDHGRFECLEQAFGNMTYNDGPQPALARLTRMSRTDRAVAANCHRITHRMGSAALARFKDRVAPAFIAGSPVCASGYYHGIVERAFLGQPTSRLAVVARRLCRDPQIDAKPFLAYQCVHGLGHGLMIYTGYDLPRSLRTCDKLQTDVTRVSCTGGVFMENFTSSYGVRSRYLRRSDPIYPCNAVAERHKTYCYLLVTSNLLRVTNHDQRRTAAGCRRSEPEWVATCFESFGRDVSGIAGRDAGKALASCRLAGRNEDDCLYGVAREIVNADAAAGARRGGRFCRQVPAGARARCFNGVGSVLASLVIDRTKLRAECRAVSGRYAAACREGAGLPPERPAARATR